MNNQSGYTLFLVLELIIVIMVLFSITLRDIHFARVLAIRETQRSQALLLSESGIARAGYFLSGNEGKSILWQSDGFNDSIPRYGKIAIVNKRYGLFSRITSRGTRVRTICATTALAGRRLPEICAPVLTLHGKAGSLALMPGSAIQGTAVLSRGRICKGESSQDAKEKGLSVKIQESPTLPFDSSQAIDVIKAFEKERAVSCTSKTVSPIAAELKPGQSDTESIETIAGDCKIEKGSFANRAIVVYGTLTLSGGASCFLCRFSAKKVEIEGGSSDRCVFFSETRSVIARGTHNSQFFGKDSIVVGKEAAFGPMSVVMLRREGVKDSTSSIFIEPKSNIRGTLLCSSDSAARIFGRLPTMIFGKGSAFTGVCMTDGDIDAAEVAFTGHVWARSIVTSDGKKAYVNYLFKTAFRPGNERVVFPLLGSGNVSIVIDRILTAYSVRKRAEIAVKASAAVDSSAKAREKEKPL